MKQDMKSRMQRMFLQDCVMVWVDVLLLWSAVGFVLFSILGIVDDPQIRFAMYCGSGLLMLFNTASAIAMITHYAEDKDFIYGLDIKHLDANRAAVKLAKSGAAASR